MPRFQGAETGTGGGLAALTAYRWVVLAGLLLMLGANLPGHMTVDSVIQLFEGRNGVHLTFNPPIMAWLLGRFDDLVPGTGLYVTACAALLSASLLGLAALRPRTSWIGVVLTAGVLLTPQLVVYQAIVWKDVLFANLSVAGFLCVAFAVRDWTRPTARILPLATAVLLLAAAGLARQNGLICDLMAALALAWAARGGGWRSSALWGAGFFAVVLLTNHAIGLAVQPPGTTMASDTRKGVRVLEHYDIVGALAHDPKLRLDVVAKTQPAAAAQIRTRGVRVYSPQRVDTLQEDPGFPRALWDLPDDLAQAQWRDIVVHHTGAYLAHRFDVFRWMVAPPDIDRCLPYTTGVDGPPDMMAALDLPHGWEPQDTAMGNYVTWFIDTPLYSHIVYGAVALGVALILMLRRDPVDVVIAAMMLAGLGFAASFFLISVACDFRYLYFLDVAAMAGLLYLALDPPIASRRSA